MRSIGNGSKDQPNHFQSSVVLSILGRLHFPVFEIYKSFQRDLYFIKYSWPCFERISNAVHWNAGGAGWKLMGENEPLRRKDAGVFRGCGRDQNLLRKGSGLQTFFRGEGSGPASNEFPMRCIGTPEGQGGN